MKNNLPLIIALVLPILVIIGVVAAIQISKNSIQPAYNIVFVTENPYPGAYNGFRYEVEGNKIIKQTLPEPPENNKYYGVPGTPRLYIYDFEKEESLEITFEEAERLTVLGNKELSPDGYRVSYSYGGHMGIFEIFGSSNRERGWIVYRDSREVFKPMRVPDDHYYYNNVEVFGWINK